ncbi:MAG: class I lanthipeptide [Bacteroidetes bacterium]|nr:class I lanthipeptide [Bacteroidota bacterium]
MKKKKLLLNKITVSNLSEDIAKSIYGGGATDPSYQCTMATACGQTCDPAACYTNAACPGYGPQATYDEPTCHH